MKGIIHGAQSPISNKHTANALGCCNNGLENVVCIGNGQADSAASPVKQCSTTLSCMHDPEIVVCYEHHPQDKRIKETDVNGTLGTFGNSIEGKDTVITQHVSVRRLMPIECERLMGFPDNWTAIPWNGKSAEDCPDSLRYKACGNSMCVNVMRWIGMNIDNVAKEI